ncbi:MAG TPA: hypothetical protein VH120_14620 [Gemmataceae bacterium]|nr:hypothetical protein [Gemmataceae bacterium]
MQPDVIRRAPSSVLVVLADADRDASQIVSGLQPHYALVCTNPAEAVEAALPFEPDVVLLDLRIADIGTVIRNLTQAAGGRRLVFVAMPESVGSAAEPPAGFSYVLPLPATAGELEQLLWQIRQDPTPVLPSAGPAGTEKIG